MKAQHRHQLQTNILADSMGRLLKGMKGSPKNTSVLVWVFLVLTLATYGIWQYQVSASQAHRSELWVQLDSDLRDPSQATIQAELQGGGRTTKLENLADENAGSIPGRTALFAVARLRYQEGQDKLLAMITSERKRAVESLVAARTLYKRLAGECLDSPALAQEALMAVAKVEESLSAIRDPKDEDKPIFLGSLDEALEYYRKVVAKTPKDFSTSLGRAAEKRIEELEDAGTRKKVEQFYAEMSAKINQPIDLPKFPEPKGK